MIVERAVQNPIITPADVAPSRAGYKVVGAFNAGAIAFDDEILLLLRVAECPEDTASEECVAPIYDPASREIRCVRVSKDDSEVKVNDSRSFTYRGNLLLTSISHLRLARSRDGIHFDIAPSPAVFPETDYETYGLEDPRITFIRGDAYYIAYKAVSESGICAALLRTTDFVRFERMGRMLCPENIDVALFPERIGDYYYALTRPVPFYIGPRGVWLARSPDLIHWGGHAPLVPPRPGGFDGGKTGGSCVPIKTKDGWLEIYHGSDEDDRYSLAVVLLDLNDPYRVIARSKSPIL